MEHGELVCFPRSCVEAKMKALDREEARLATFVVNSKEAKSKSSSETTWIADEIQSSFKGGHQELNLAVKQALDQGIASWRAECVTEL